MTSNVQKLIEENILEVDGKCKVVIILEGIATHGFVGFLLDKCLRADIEVHAD